MSVNQKDSDLDKRMSLLSMTTVPGEKDRNSIKKGHRSKKRVTIVCGCLFGVTLVLVSWILYVCLADGAYPIRMTITNMFGVEFADHTPPAKLRKFFVKLFFSNQRKFVS